MSFSLDRTDDRLLVTVDGQLVVANRQEFKQAILDGMEQGRASSWSISPTRRISTAPVSAPSCRSAAACATPAAICASSD